MAESRSVSFADISRATFNDEIPCSYDAAEECADRALRLEPILNKARYRRGVARKKNLQLAKAAIGTFIAFCLHARQSL